MYSLFLNKLLRNSIANFFVIPFCVFYSLKPFALLTHSHTAINYNKNNHQYLASKHLKRIRKNVWISDVVRFFSFFSFLFFCWYLPHVKKTESSQRNQPVTLREQTIYKREYNFSVLTFVFVWWIFFMPRVSHRVNTHLLFCLIKSFIKRHAAWLALGSIGAN